MLVYLILAILISFLNSCKAQPPDQKTHIPVVCGAERTDEYLPFLKDRNVALIVNHTSLIGNTHLLDSLLAHKTEVVKVFAPEHGFRGDADAGAHVASGVDTKTGIPVVSLYGSKKKPDADDLKNIDIVIFDIQDVGARFYTYISTMSLAMEACAENHVAFLVLDRPNPNGFYVDGPVLEPKHASFVGMHPVPVVHGMTVGEYATMVNEEGWLANGIRCRLEVVRMKNYTHQTLYQLPVKPSPNLPDMTTVYLYPSVCFFEGTFMSVGRGTQWPFRIIGHPEYKAGNMVFTPVRTEGASLNPPFKDQSCYGFDLSYLSDSVLTQKRLQLQPLLDAWNFFKGNPKFFNNYFNTLAGNETLRSQIEAGLSETEIRKSWQNNLERFKKIRTKHLLYPD